MSREKQIEEMAKKICPCIYNHNDCESCDLYEHESCLPFNIARELTDNGYRKADEVRADTVQKMRSAIEKHYSRPQYKPTREHPTKHTQIDYMLSVIAQIAKEMLEGRK